MGRLRQAHARHRGAAACREYVARHRLPRACLPGLRVDDATRRLVLVLSELCHVDGVLVSRASRRADPRAWMTCWQHDEAVVLHPPDKPCALCARVLEVAKLYDYLSDQGDEHVIA